MKRPVRCGSGHPDGYLCERPPNHAGEHCAFIGAHDEQGKIPELSWPAAALPGAEAGTPEKCAYLTQEDLSHLQGDDARTLLNIASFPSHALSAFTRETLAAIAERLAALTSEVRALTAQRDFAAQQEKSWESALEAAMAKYDAAMTEVAALREDKARLDCMESITGDVDQLLCPPGNHGGEITNWLLTHEGSTTYKSWEAPTLREVIDAARLASPSPTGAPAEQQKN